MCTKVYIAPVDPRMDSCAECLLKLVHAADERAEVRIAIGVGPGDVTGVAGKLRAGVDEHRMALGRGFRFQHLVVQYSTAGVESDDRVVGQLHLTQAARLQERQLGLEFTGTGLERARRRRVAQRAEPARYTHTFLF